VNHLGQVEPAVPATIEDWERGISCIADQTNVALKVSGLWTIDRNWSIDALRPVLSRALFHLGANRLMFGSNLPIEKLMAPISRQIASLQRLLEDEPEGTISQILCQTCRTFYRLA
jgi:predicted TIM-barrel fold metal-dependent hydrolase